MFTNTHIQSQSQLALDYRAVTGRHDEHFLRRTDRLAPQQADFALALYRDHGLMRVLLGQLQVSDSVERVAISLKHAQRGPFIVVARDGHFVTCLGEGMRVGNTPIVTRGEFDQVARRVERARSIIANVESHARGEVERALNRLAKRGMDVSREEFRALAAWQPLLAPTFLKMFLEIQEHLGATYHLLAFRQSAWKHRDEPALRAYYRQCWALAHLCMLLGADGGEFLRSLVDRPHFAELAQVLTCSLVHLNVTSHAIRGMWLASRIGKPMISSLKAEYLSAPSPRRMVDAGLALSAIGHAHRKLHAEIGKTLQSDYCEHGAQKEFATAFRPVIAGHFRSFAAQPQASERFVSEVSDLILDALSKAQPDRVPSSPYRPTGAREIGLGMLLLAPFPVMNEGSHMLGTLLAFLPSLVRAKAEEFYLPRRYIDRSRETTDLEGAIRLIEPRRAHDHRAGTFAHLRPRPRSERVGRNVTCPCGSQRKFKHCCSGRPSTLH